jgi:response regulator RpfG family c-di-GMP phosphodiesterase
LTLLDATPFDVVVSDISMPGMDGAALMKTVCERYPALVRVVLSGPQEMEGALRAVPVAHQFLLKPCDPDILRVTVERATSLSKILSNKLLANLVGSVQDLPVLPRTCLALKQKLAEPDASIQDVVRVVEQDVAISANILQLVNSAFFGLPREVSSVRTAVGFLGIDTLQNLVLSAGVFTIFDRLAKLPGFSCAELQAHSQLTAKIAGQIPASAHVRGVAVVAGLLHDVGKLVLATRAAAHFKRALEETEAEGRPYICSGDGPEGRFTCRGGSLSTGHLGAAVAGGGSSRAASPPGASAAGFFGRGRHRVHLEYFGAAGCGSRAVGRIARAVAN